ncbi:hypothetical protein DLH72_01110 [Candidatus Gracilibacteria bacterium]|nr:MAG: hypothetical protein DLH72_01110 [Candidatus Gracilibacteria bacterium]
MLYFFSYFYYYKIKNYIISVFILLKFFLKQNFFKIKTLTFFYKLIKFYKYFLNKIVGKLYCFYLL